VTCESIWTQVISHLRGEVLDIYYGLKRGSYCARWNFFFQLMYEGRPPQMSYTPMCEYASFE
jgi:hypothetical protein